jgi:hypothetical protein
MISHGRLAKDEEPKNLFPIYDPSAFDTDIGNVSSFKLFSRRAGPPKRFNSKDSDSMDSFGPPGLSAGHPIDKFSQAATTIQSVFRGHLTRVQVNSFYLTLLVDF